MQKKKWTKWRTVHEILTRTRDEWIPYVIHPCDEQYTSLVLLENSHELFTPKLLFSESEWNQISEEIDYEAVQLLSKHGVWLENGKLRECPGIEYLAKISEIKGIKIEPTWYDGTYRNELREEARQCIFYPLQEETDQRMHLPWWMIIWESRIMAFVNVKTEIQLLLDGEQMNILGIAEQENAKKEVLKQMSKANFLKTIAMTQDLLRQNGEWKERYVGYAKAILEKTSIIENARKSFRQWQPLTIYVKTTYIRKAKESVLFDVRYYGQIVANLTAKKDGSVLLSSRTFDEKNQRDFGIPDATEGMSGYITPIHNVDWAGPEAAAFRKFFKERVGPRNKGKNKGNEEHRLESLWLTELLKQKGKALGNIKAVTVGNVRFPMPTPISASSHGQIKYSGLSGGGIDIFARAGTGGVNTNLCIIELKDENTKKEPQEMVLEQAVSYATFIRELLRSDCGQDWWKIFGFGGKVPEKLVLCAVSLMPSGVDNELTYDGMELDIDGDIIKLQSIYFSETNNTLQVIHRSF